MVLKARDRLNVSALAASVIVATLLIALKLWALGTTGALSIAASLTDSALDFLMSVTGLLAILYAAKPADEDHAFGHSSAEDLAALAQSALVTASAIAIGWAAVARLTSPVTHVLTDEGRGMVAMAASIVLTIALVLWQRKVAAKTGSRVVAADSLHYLSDLMPNIGAIVALLASSLYGITQIDAIVAIAASVVLLVGAMRIGRGAFDALMDRQAPAEIIEKVEDMVHGWPGVVGHHDLKTRSAGSMVFIQIHIELDGGQTLNEAHAIGAGLRHAILDAVPNSEVIIHKDPVRDNVEKS